MPISGKIRRSVDRNGNALTFTYDDSGRLVTVTDTLDRDITIAYHADGFVKSVTDFSGRQVRYDYYQNGDSSGSFGDLKSATTAAVTATPNGNDFPDGKTTVFTYSTGFRDDRLNHNLLTVTDPKGQTYLRNIYATTENPQDLIFNRVIRQVWGNSDDIIDIHYT